MNMLDYVVDQTAEYINRMPKEERKKYGQFFTSKESAIFMASLFRIPENMPEVYILDPGAGSGILSVALLERLNERQSVTDIHLVCYENDVTVAELLQHNLAWVSSRYQKHFTYEIVNDNYIVSQREAYNATLSDGVAGRKFDFIIGNPPYKKISKDAPEAVAMPDVCYGAPNLYFLFASMSLFNLKHDGEMVYIIPRSWTSGAYFRKFRQKFLKEASLEHIHLFISRDKVFEKENVLQETIIIKAKKNSLPSHEIVITTSKSNHDFNDKTLFKAPYTTVVHGKEDYVYLVTNSKDVDTLNALHKWNQTLPDIGLKMKTGLTVDFRNRDALRNEAEEHAVPLFYSQHIKNGEVIFPAGKEHEYIVTEQRGLLQENKNYLFVKRFTAKEERRRLQCGIYLSKKYPQYAQISTQNKLNFIDGVKALSECLVCGLYVLFNSTLYDCYYRILNGSTQVNSTEINSMPVPTIDIIESMGKKLMTVQDLSEASCNHILRSYI